jgi:hypothetical protein
MLKRALEFITGKNSFRKTTDCLSSFSDSYGKKGKCGRMLSGD